MECSESTTTIIETVFLVSPVITLIIMIFVVVTQRSAFKAMMETITNYWKAKREDSKAILNNHLEIMKLRAKLEGPKDE